MKRLCRIPGLLPIGLVGMHVDGRVSWDDGPVLHIGRDRHHLEPADPASPVAPPTTASG
jgi:hypothetical protein